MKRVLVVDESAAVRETLGLILGRDFVVIQKPLFADDPLSYGAGDADLLILGVPPGWSAGSSLFSRIASRLSLPALFLVDSASAMDFMPGGGKVDCLAKPFNPYDLRTKVERLLAPPDFPAAAAPSPRPRPGQDALRSYLEFPYLPAST